MQSHTSLITYIILYGPLYFLGLILLDPRLSNSQVVPYIFFTRGIMSLEAHVQLNATYNWSKTKLNATHTLRKLFQIYY